MFPPGASLGRRVGDGWAPKDRVFQGNRNAPTMEHKASRLDVKSLPNWAQEAEERSLQRQSKKHCSGLFQQGSLPS